MLLALATTPQALLTSQDHPISQPEFVQRTGDFTRLWIAIDQALGGIDEWRETYNRCAFIERDCGRALVVEADGDAQVAVSYRQPDQQRDLEDVAVWSFALDDNGIRDISINREPAQCTSVNALTDLFWVFHRLAVEDRASMLRS